MTKTTAPVGAGSPANKPAAPNPWAPRVERVDVEGYPPIHVRALNGLELDYVMETFDGSISEAEANRLIVALAACDEHGAPLFEPGDTAAVGAMALVVVQRAAERAAEINKLGDDPGN